MDYDVYTELVNGYLTESKAEVPAHSSSGDESANFMQMFVFD